MAHPPRTPSKLNRFTLNQKWFKQKGAALIFMAFILGLGAAVYVLKTYNADAARAKQDEKTYQALKDAKVALIAWAVNHPNTPGLMPYPDRNGDGNYDDTSDCYASNVNFSPSFTIGRLPLFKSDPNCVNAKNAVTTGLSGDFRDGTGQRLWYEVSQNLLHDYKNNGDPAGTSPIINPSIVNTPTYKWFVVRDRSGAIISDRVAAVIVAPGAPVGDQDRSSGIAGANQYLDKVYMVGGTAYTNYTYYDSAMPTLLQEFIIGDDMRAVSKTDPTYKNQTTEPYYFNDKLVYITIDELMEALEKRVGEQVRSSLKTYKDTNGYYPYAAHLGTTLSYVADGNLLSGFLPIFQKCSYSVTSSTNRSLNCTQPIFDTATSGITTIRFYLPSGDTFSSSSGVCTRASSDTRCDCTGVGSCSNAALTFSCASASCSATGVGATGDVRIRGGNLTFNSGGCSFTTILTQNAITGCPIYPNTRVTCNSTNGMVAATANSDVALENYIPPWFKANRWQEYVYYHMTRPALSTIGVGAKSAEATVVMTGRAIDSVPYALSKGLIQTRPVCNSVNNYLDSGENADGDSEYDSTSTQRSSNYNDQTFVVSP